MSLLLLTISNTRVNPVCKMSMPSDQLHFSGSKYYSIPTIRITAISCSDVYNCSCITQQVPHTLAAHYTENTPAYS